MNEKVSILLEDIKREDLALLIIYAPNMDRSNGMVSITTEALTGFKKVKLFTIDGNMFPEVQDYFDIESDPTTLFFRKGQEVNRLVGIKAKKIIENELKNFN